MSCINMEEEKKKRGKEKEEEEKRLRVIRRATCPNSFGRSRTHGNQLAAAGVVHVEMVSMALFFLDRWFK